MTAAIPCISEEAQCPYYNYCIARLNNKTVVGCGMALYVDGSITYEEIGVMHSITVYKAEQGVNE